MENKKHIDQLLEKFWAGETNLAEESILRKAINNPKASEELKELRSLFQGPSQSIALTTSATDKFDQAFQAIQMEALLEKYWEGETSLEEEASLREAVYNPLATNKLIAARNIFTAPAPKANFSKEGEAKMEAFFTKIQREEGKVKTLPEAKVKKLPKRNLLKIAVVGLLLIGIGGIWTNRVNNLERAEAQLAYEQTKEALELLGMHFNKGQEATLNSVKDASDNLGILN